LAFAKSSTLPCRQKDKALNIRRNLDTILIVSFAAALFACSGARADSLVDGDAEAGKSKSTACGACHGANGNSQNPEWPNLAAQHAKYVYQQLQYFKDGDRNNVLMNGQAMALSDQDMQDLAVYFESLQAQPLAVANADTVATAEALYRGGDKERGIPACLACHGPDGAGNPGVPYPKINGQHAVYTATSLKNYAADDTTRSNTATQQMMTTIAQKLTPQEIEALASYLQGLK
jgi:cytochrome c553